MESNKDLTPFGLTPFGRMGKRVVLEEVCLRDGLQGEARRFSVEERCALARMLLDAGIKRLQIGSFVHPGWVPQMEDMEEVFASLPKRTDVIYTALVLNEAGLKRAISVGVSHLYVAVSASDAHSRKNSHRPFQESLRPASEVIRRAKAEGISVRAGIMVAFGCPYEGSVPIERVLEIASHYAKYEVDMIDLADTAGLANPKQVYDLVTAVQAEVGNFPLSLHLHDTRGLGPANLLAGLRAGVNPF